MATTASYSFSLAFYSYYSLFHTLQTRKLAHKINARQCWKITGSHWHIYHGDHFSVQTYDCLVQSKNVSLKCWTLCVYTQIVYVVPAADNWRFSVRQHTWWKLTRDISTTTITFQCKLMTVVQSKNVSNMLNIIHTQRCMEQWKFSIVCAVSGR